MCSSASGPHDPEKIGTPDLLDGCLTVAASQEFSSHIHGLTGVSKIGYATTVIEVSANTDVINADAVDDVIYVVNHGSDTARAEPATDGT